MEITTKKKLFVLLSLPLLLSVLLLSSCQRATGDRTVVRIATGGHVVHFLPYDIAKHLGFFEDEGLDVRTIYTVGGTATANALVSRQVDFSGISIDHAFKLALQGETNFRMVTLMNQTPGMVLLVDSRHRDRVQSIADLRGMTIGVTARGAATHMVLNFLLEKNGVSHEDVNVIGVGAAALPGALMHNNVDAGIALEPFASILVDSGDAFALVDLNSYQGTSDVFGGPYNQAGIVTREDVIRERPEVVQKVVNAVHRALIFIQEHSPEEIVAILPPEIVGTDIEQYKASLKKLRDFYSPTGIVNPIGAENVLQSMIMSNVIPADFRYNATHFINNDFINERNNE